MRTQVGIIGAGPAGLLLSHLLAQHGIESVILESRSREYVEKRVRAGVLEHGTVELLKSVGLGERLEREGLRHDGTWLRFAEVSHRIDFPSLTGGKNITVYGQQEVVKDLIQARLEAGQILHFEAQAMHVEGITANQPSIAFTLHGQAHTLECDFIAGCDGFHGVARDAIPAGVLNTFERIYPFAWLGILAEAAPASHELIYANHERGFALHSMRSQKITRNYIQVPQYEDINTWSDEAIWDELDRRLETKDGFKLIRGPIFEKGITGMRSFVVEPMQYGKLFLAGDAAHIVPPTGAKGMNLAINDVRVLAEALEHHYRMGSGSGLEAYSSTALKRIWRAQYFSWWMTSMLHRSDANDPYEHKLQLAQLEFVCSNEAAAQTLAENYVGMLGGVPAPGVAR
jgi:p-hydroxybenzoate 3-monooxygenase